jgi:hypothetical protein
MPLDSGTAGRHRADHRKLYTPPPITEDATFIPGCDRHITDSNRNVDPRKSVQNRRVSEQRSLRAVTAGSPEP